MKHNKSVIPEVLVLLALLAIHDIQELLGKLEWGRLERKISRGVRQHETEVDVDDVPVSIK